MEYDGYLLMVNSFTQARRSTGYITGWDYASVFELARMLELAYDKEIFAFFRKIEYSVLKLQSDSMEAKRKEREKERKSNLSKRH